jgi:hypothetical protein
VRVAVPLATIAAVGVALLLGGCATDGAPDAQPSATQEATPEPTATAEAPDDALFTITANVRDSSGATIGIQLTAREPVAYSHAKAEPLIDEFVKTCGEGVGGTPVTAETLATNGSILMRIDLASSTSGKQFQVPLDLSLGSPYFGQSATGTGVKTIDPMHPCYGGYRWSTSGSATAVADFESGNPGPDLTLWQFANYGFSVPFDSDATIEACRVVLSEKAAADVAGEPGWDPAGAANGVSCMIGYVGE